MATDLTKEQQTCRGHMSEVHRLACPICNPKEPACTTPQAIDTTQNIGRATTTTEMLTSNLVDTLRRHSNPQGCSEEELATPWTGSDGLFFRASAEIERLTKERDTARRCLELTQEQQRGSHETPAGHLTDPAICGEDGPITPDQCALWLDAKYRRHGELEDRAAAMWLRKLSAKHSAVETTVPHPDTVRLDWLQAKTERFANIDRITSVNGKFNGYSTLREAIDNADTLQSPEKASVCPECRDVSCARSRGTSQACTALRSPLKASDERGLECGDCGSHSIIEIEIEKPENGTPKP